MGEDVLLEGERKANSIVQLLPDYVLLAERVLVVIHPDASEGVTNPMANRTARDELPHVCEEFELSEQVNESSSPA